MDSHDDDLQLPEDTQRILKEFLAEQAKKDKEEITEDWNLSQFWYSDETQKFFGKLVKRLIAKNDDEEFSVALLSCPSLFQTMRSINDKTKIFEFDKRFESYGEFQFYDYNKASEENYLGEYASSFDLIIADPPFLSQECLEKTSVIIKRLIKDSTGMIILNTGSIQRDLASQLLNLKESSYKPQHKNNLGNEFSSFTNFDLDKFM